MINLVRESPVILWNWDGGDISINITLEYLYGLYYCCRAKKECSVSITQKFSINIDGERGASMRELVARGVYPSLSSAFDAAAAVLLEQEAAKEAWWKEVIRRCNEAERYPEKLLDLDIFFRNVQDRIDRRRKSCA